MTEKLFENAYLTEFEAQVVSCEEKNGTFEVVLDRTAFFPEGGGQPADEGKLGRAKVLDVQEKDGVIVHTVNKRLSGTVVGRIAWDVRFARMQNHTGEHIVSGIVHRIFGCNNVGFHMGKTCMTVDFDGALDGTLLALVEAFANKTVCENRAVTVSFPEHPETLEYRSKLDLTEGVRLVTIEGVDVCACCAPHVSSTGEVGLIKILSMSPHRGGTRITMVCGLDAFSDYSMLHETAGELSRMLSVPREEVSSGVKKLTEDLARAQDEIKALKRELTKATLETVTVGDWTVGFTGKADFDTLRGMVNERDGNLALFAKSGEYMLRGAGAGELTKKLNAACSGKGGGKPDFTQGKCTASKRKITAFFEEMK